jgi:hypothetical protein
MLNTPLEPTLESLLAQLPPGSSATLFHIQIVQIKMDVLGHMTAGGTGLRGLIELWGIPAGGAPAIHSAKIHFHDDAVPTSRPVFDAVAAEVKIYAKLSQAAAMIAQLRGSTKLMLVYSESPAVDEVAAGILSYDSFLLTEKVP